MRLPWAILVPSCGNLDPKSRQDCPRSAQDALKHAWRMPQDCPETPSRPPRPFSRAVTVHTWLQFRRQLSTAPFARFPSGGSALSARAFAHRRQFAPGRPSPLVPRPLPPLVLPGVPLAPTATHGTLERRLCRQNRFLHGCTCSPTSLPCYGRGVGSR